MLFSSRMFAGVTCLWGPWGQSCIPNQAGERQAKNSGDGSGVTERIGQILLYQGIAPNPADSLSNIHHLLQRQHLNTSRWQRVGTRGCKQSWMGVGLAPDNPLQGEHLFPSPLFWETPRPPCCTTILYNQSSSIKTLGL